MRRFEDVSLWRAEHYFERIKNANALRAKGPEESLQAVAVFETEWTNIQQAHSWLLETHNKTKAIRNLISLYAYHAADFLQPSYSPEIQIQWFEPALESARQSGNQSRLGAHLNNLALAYNAAGRRDLVVSMYEERIALAQRMGDLEGEGAAQCNLGIFLKDSGRMSEAISCMTRSLELDRRLGNALRECESLAGLGSVHLTMGDIAKATEYYEQALAKMGKSEYETQGVILGNLASCSMLLGNRERARELYSERIRLARQCQDSRGLALALANWALLVSDDRPAEALPACREAIEINVREPRIRGNVLNIYGMVLRRNGDRDGAIANYEEALTFARKSGDNVLHVSILGNLGLLMAERGNSLRAAELFEEQRQNAQAFSLKRQEAWALDQLSSHYYACGDLDRAIQYVELAIGLREGIQDEKTVVELKHRLELWRRHSAAIPKSDG